MDGDQLIRQFVNVKFLILKIAIIFCLTLSMIPDVNASAMETTEDVQREIELGDMELLAQLVQAEAGNQDLMGMRLVAGVVLNRIDSPKFPDTMEEVIYQKKQFSCVKDGGFDKAAWNMSEKAYLAVELEMEARIDDGILYFSSTKSPVNGKDAWKHGDHWFSY